MQLQVGSQELSRLVNRIEQDFRGALADHQRRMDRFRRYYRRWRARVDVPAAGEEDLSNFRVPLTQWNVFAKWAVEMDALFGEDAEVVAVPVGPSDQKTAHKIGRYMSWRLFDSMRILPKFTTFEFRKILFGRAHAYAPWVEDTYRVLGKDGKMSTDTWYEGPGFEPLWPDDLVVPAEDVDSIQDFSFVVRKLRLTPQKLMDGERAGRYVGITDNWENILALAEQRNKRDYQSDTIKLEKDEAEGVLYEGSLAGRDTVLVWEWYGKHRFRGKNGKPLPDESELLVYFIPDLHLCVGVKDLIELYPHMRNRRPFVEASLIRDGSYWSPGFGELLEQIEEEITVNHNLATQAGQFSVGPVIFYKPGVGFKAEEFKYSPNTAIPVEDPSGIKVVELRADMSYSITKEQTINGYGEKVTGQSDQTMGRAIDRPNAPRTASGQMALIEQGNIRASLDTRTMREDLRAMLFHFWMLDSYFGDPNTFFRVTEEDADGLFDVRNGGATLTAAERGGRYDFDLRFATGLWSREARKERYLQLYQLMLANPFVVSNPKLLSQMTREVCMELQAPELAALIPEIPESDLPKTPKEEWTLMLQGEDVDPNPADNDDLHLMDHYKRLAMEKQSKPEERDPDAENRMVAHIIAHQRQKQEKKMMAALTQQLTQQIGAATADPAMGGLHNRPAIPIGIQQLQQTLGQMGGQPGPGPGMPQPGGAPPMQQPQQQGPQPMNPNAPSA